MKLKPLFNYIFLEPVEESKTTKSGLVIPDSQQDKSVKGRVLAVGDGRCLSNGERLPVSVKVGDIVLFKKYGMDEIEVEGKLYLVGEEDGILAIIYENL